MADRYAQYEAELLGNTGNVLASLRILSHDASSMLPSCRMVQPRMAGAIGLMTLAVMTRATLGHTGRTLRADRWTAGIYLLMIAAVGVRLLATLLPGLGYEMYVISGVCWVGAFSLFVIVYGPILLSNPR